MIVARASTPGTRAPSLLRRCALPGLLLVVVTAALLAPAAAGAVPLQYPNAWTFAPSGLRQLPDTTDTRALCKGPNGSVYEVALGTNIAYDAVMARVRVSDGKVIRSWAYPAVAGAAGYVPRAAACDSKGDLVVAMETMTAGSDWRVVKFTRTGAVVWQRRYDSGHGQDTPYGVAIDHHDAVIVVGTSAAPDGYDSAIVKWSGSGTFRWKQVVGSPGQDLIGAVAVDKADNVYVAGELAPGGTPFDRGTVRSYRPSGHMRWAANVSDPQQPVSFSSIVVKGSGVYVAGEKGGGDPKLVAAKYTTAGTPAWGGLKTRAYVHGAWSQDLAVDGKGSAVVVGYAYSAGSAGEYLGTVWKLRPGGGTAWHREFSNPAWPHDGEFDAVGVDSKGLIYAAGGVQITSSTGSLLMVRYSPGGSEQALWRARGQQSGYCVFSDVLVLSDTKVLAAGQVGGVLANAGVYRAKTTR